MTVFIPEDKVAEIKHTADIVDIVSEVVLLKKTGKNHLGLCPFHTEKTPSFTVSPDKQIFHCFGCGEGGNVFSFLMKHNGVSFPEAVQMIARRYGIDIPTQSMSIEQKKRFGERERIFSVNKAAMTFFYDNLMHVTAGQKAVNYLQKRGITKEIIEQFRLGYAPGTWDSLLKMLQKKGISHSLAHKTGIIVPRGNGNGYYDRFRDRIIFPIFDRGMQVIGFGGRVMDDSLPKYLNSPETPVYNKSKSLYGLHHAKKECRETGAVFIVEGYFDLISLVQHGLGNAVATLGTALTSEHVQIIRGLIGKSGKVILVYDSDEAGIKAARRSIEVFEKSFVDAGILVLPTGHDPDSYLFEFGVESFKKAAAGSLGIISFLIESAVKKYGLSIEGKIQTISDLQGPLSAITNSVARSLYIKELAEKTGIDEAAVLEKIRTTAVKTAHSGNKWPGHAIDTMVAGHDKTSQDKWKRIEEQIIAMMLQSPGIIPEIRNKKVLDNFESNTLKQIGHLIIEHKDFHVNGDVSNLMACLNDNTQRRIIASLAIGEDIWNDNGCRKLIAQFLNSRNNRKKTLLKEIKAAEDRNDHELLLKLLKEKQILVSRKGISNLEFAGGETL